ncbi:MAG: sarcosine oxidase subunit delta [Actinobacteria bacterium]|nr:MAG: sarcosine oxidase subunit delta [Actinomycetota bacterium]
MGLRIVCPTCGSRQYTEFWFGGEVPDPGEEEFERVWLRSNTAGLQRERWFHYAGCRRWLTVERDTRTNEIHAVA